MGLVCSLHAGLPAQAEALNALPPFHQPRFWSRKSKLGGCTAGPWCAAQQGAGGGEEVGYFGSLGRVSWINGNRVATLRSQAKDIFSEAAISWGMTPESRHSLWNCPHLLPPSPRAC